MPKHSHELQIELMQPLLADESDIGKHRLSVRRAPSFYMPPPHRQTVSAAYSELKYIDIGEMGKNSPYLAATCTAIDQLDSSVLDRLESLEAKAIIGAIRDSYEISYHDGAYVTANKEIAAAIGVFGLCRNELQPESSIKFMEDKHEQILYSLPPHTVCKLNGGTLDQQVALLTKILEFNPKGSLRIDTDFIQRINDLPTQKQTVFQLLKEAIVENNVLHDTPKKAVTASDLEIQVLDDGELPNRSMSPH